MLCSVCSVANSDRNLWFTYDSVEDLDALLVSLHCLGVHDARLKREIKYRYQGIAKMIQDNNNNNGYFLSAISPESS